MSKQYYVYILTNSTNSVLYTGVTNDLTRRLYEHNLKTNGSFTGKYSVKKLVYYEVLDDAANAIAREKQLKRLPRKKKEELIARYNRGWLNLAEEMGLR